MNAWKIYTILLLFPLFFATPVEAQVAKNVVVEHFTNTRCGICSSRNPGFYQNLNNQEGVIHIAYHPSAPYSSCVLNQHNSSENDARTNYYNIYGSTPRLVIQGTNISPGTNYSSASIWNPFVDETTEVSIAIEQEKQADLIKAKITLTTEATHSLGDLNLFISVAEDTVFYNAPNNEDLHFDVFRKALPDINGFPVTLPSSIGESVSFTVETAVDADWDLDRMFVVAILQQPTTKEVIQAASSSAADNMVITNVNNIPLLENVVIAPNPVLEQLSISLSDSSRSNVRIFNVLGVLIAEQTFVEQTQMNLSKLAKGTYLVEITNENGRFIDKIIKQ